MSRLVVDNDVAVVCSGNALGKSYFISSLFLWYIYSRPYSVVVSTSPVFSQLTGVLWENIRSAYKNSRIPLGGAICGPKASPQLLHVADGWYGIGIATTSTEKISGYRSSKGKTLVLVDEASALTSEIAEGLFSLNAEKQVYIGNPLRSDGVFLDLWNKAQRGEKGFGSLKVSSLESPDIDLWQSPRGLACQSWLSTNRSMWGEGTAWWQSHVLGEFPSANSETLIPRTWLDLCEVDHYPRKPGNGTVRLAVDLSGGKGGDNSVILVRDDNGILDIRYSKTWDFEQAASEVARAQEQWAVRSSDIAFDQGGLGHDFANRLLRYGIAGCQEYVGSKSGSGPSGKRFANLRTFAAHKMSRRLDPNRILGPAPPAEEPGKPALEPPKLTQFRIGRDHLALLRNQLQSLSLKNDIGERVRLEAKDETKKRLGCSPDFADAMIISYAF
ncbi:hypothetical protein ACYOEI_00080 [Singulisphaera rosea]